MELAKKLFKLALPIALQNLVSFLVGFADTVMLGRLGDNAVSGAYMGNQVQILLQTLIFGVEGAILAISSQYWGKQNKNTVQKIAVIGASFSTAVGVLLTTVCSFFPKTVVSFFTNKTQIIDTGVDYLKILSISFGFFCLTQSLIAAMRSVEATKIGLYVSLISLGINLILNYILIFGKVGFSALGARGAAIATLVSRVTEAVIITIYALFIDKRLGFSLKASFKIEKLLIRDFFKYGTPIILGQLVWAVNTLSCSAIIGRQSFAGAVTALTVANTLNTLAYVAVNGVSAALGIIIGKTVGEGDSTRVRRYARLAQIIFALFGLLTSIFIFFLKDPFISLYNISTESSRECARFINVLAVTALGTSYQSACLFGILKSGGDMRFVFCVELAAVFLAVIPLALIASRLGFAPWIVFACLKCDQLLKCIPAAIRVNKTNWIKNITNKSNAVPS